MLNSKEWIRLKMIFEQYLAASPSIQEDTDGNIYALFRNVDEELEHFIMDENEEIMNALTLEGYALKEIEMFNGNIRLRIVRRYLIA